MRKFSNFIKVLISFTIIQSAQAQGVPAWVKNPKTPTDEFVVKMLASDAGDKNWVYCYRCALGRSDVDSKINEQNCLNVYKVWDLKNLDEVKKACH